MAFVGRGDRGGEGGKGHEVFPPTHHDIAQRITS